MDVNAFNFDAMKETIGADPFAATANKYGKDERFYTLAKDKDGNGGAVIRFLPDAESKLIQKMFKINTTITKNGKKRFVSEFSPSTIGQPCPFQEKWQELWNLGLKDESKNYGRSIKYISNIKVLKDPANPENEGKIFLIEMSGSMKDKIQAALSPSEQDKALGAVPKELFNPLRGQSFRLVAKKGANGQITYDNSDVLNTVDGIYTTVEEALADIKANTYLLSDLEKPESFMTYDKLVDKLNWVNFSEAAAATVATVATVSNVEVAPVQNTVSEVQAAVAQPAPVAQPANKEQSLDEMLAGLV